jgi:regulatory protein
MKKITKIEECKRNKDRVNIFMDEEFYMSASKYCCIKYDLKEGLQIDTSYIDRVISEDNYGKGKNYALKVIERGMKSKKEIHDKLKLKEYSDADIDRVMSFLSEYGYADDDMYAKCYIESCKNSKSKQFIKHSLINKGIDLDIIEKYLMSIEDEEERNKAKILSLKKLNTLKGKDKKEIRKKIGDMLIRRGYEYNLIKEVVNDIMENDEDGDYYL